MRTFKQFCEDKDYMAKGIGVVKDPKMAKEMIWLAVGQGMDKDQISQHIGSSIPPAELAQAGGYSPRSVDRALSHPVRSAETRRTQDQLRSAHHAKRADLAAQAQQPQMPNQNLKLPIRPEFDTTDFKSKLVRRRLDAS